MQTNTLFNWRLGRSRPVRVDCALDFKNLVPESSVLLGDFLLTIRFILFIDDKRTFGLVIVLNDRCFEVTVELTGTVYLLSAILRLH